MYPLGWCMGKTNCNECPTVWHSTIQEGAVDYCNCDCHIKER